jgi:hypothetical protein
MKNGIRTSEMYYNFSIRANLLQHNCRAIIKQSYGEKSFRIDRLILSDNIASLAYPPNAKISSFLQTALSGYSTAQPADLPPSSK